MADSNLLAIPGEARQAGRTFVQDLKSREAEAVALMERTYLTAAKRMAPMWAQAAKRLQEAQSAGYSPEYLAGLAWNEQRLATILADLTSAWQDLAKDSGAVMKPALKKSAALASTSANRQLTAGIPDGIALNIQRAPLAELQTLTGRLRDNSPLDEVLKDLSEKKVQAMRDELVAGVASGDNSNVIGRRMAKILGESFGRARLIAQTELLNVYRDTHLEVFQANKHLVKGWRWVAARQDRTCPICWAMDGTEHPLEERFASHPGCRCSVVAIRKSYADIDPRLVGIGDISRREPGALAFRKLDKDRQRKILGPGLFRAYDQNLVKLEDIPQVTFSQKWGAGRKQQSLTALVGEQKARELRGLGQPKPDLGKTAPLPVGRMGANGPDGVPISQFVNAASPSETGRAAMDEAKAALALVDQVIGDGKLKTVPLRIEAIPSKHGVYRSDLDGNPLGISITPDNPHARMTMVHETGHYLDQQLFGQRYRAKALSEDYDLIMLPRDFASESEYLEEQNFPGMFAWRKAVTNSEAYQSLGVLGEKAKRFEPITFASGQETYLDSQYISYMLKPDEAFARSFAQYVSHRTGDPVLKATIQKERAGVYGDQQWSDEDFEPIAEAFDLLFWELGGRK